MKGESGHLQRKLQSCLWPQSGKKPWRHGYTQECFHLRKEEAQRGSLLNKYRQSLGWQGQQIRCIKMVLKVSQIGLVRLEYPGCVGTDEQEQGSAQNLKI